ncbi:YebC/PmpR family DNA-binding transcriptional regulator [Candidatus Gottesmanbacteria bacterium]|nr:YebC/PmpR family DNA-binding transcriptional regulator [Candidatus Gottesmanbacteria bacterium]
MSGHSKWSQIKRQKGLADQKRGQAFTKLANAITIAVRAGGGITDPNSNFKLRLAIEKAKALNMAKENIQRALRRAQGELGGEIEEVIYEGFGPGGVAILIEAATSNRQRIAQELKNIFENSGGDLAGPGATAHFFQSVGMISVALAGKTEDEIMEQAIEVGAQDLETAGREILVYTKPEELHQIREKLVQAGFKIVEAELTFKPVSVVPITTSAETAKILSFLEKLEENEAVQRVFANFDIPDEILKGLA